MITLKTLEQATAQQVFDQVATHLLAQNKHSKMRTKSTIQVPRCAYRGDGGLMCAAGCLIAGEEYNSDNFEMLSWFTLVQHALVPNAHVDLISALQRVHDCSPVSEWPLWLQRVAENFDLKTYAVM